MKNKMEDYLPQMNEQKMKRLFEIESAFKAGTLSADEAHRQVEAEIGKVKAYHIAYVEQAMKEEHENECERENVHALLNMLRDQLDLSMPELPEDHPIAHYLKENEEMKRLMKAVQDLVQYPMIRNQWLELYDKISRYPIHFKRKQNQLYPVLEQKGFTRPTTTMWTFDDRVRDAIREAERLLREGAEEQFIQQQDRVVSYALDLMDKEETVLYPTSLTMITPEEFEEMKQGDREIGFAFFDVEPDKNEQPATSKQGAADGFAHDLQALLAKYGYSVGPEQKLNVTTGRLTLDQINLIYQHLPVDISFVDENELVCFYSDTDHRIFPRSKNVIGREVMNCHPRKSAHVVRELIDKLRSGEQDRAEFWINKPGLFIYIIYIAVRDREGKFRGVLEMMQDCTHIRSLEGSQTLLTWASQETQSHNTQTEVNQPVQEAQDKLADGEQAELTPHTRLKDLLDRHPTLRQRLAEIAPEFKMLSSPLGKLMIGKADIQMMGERSGIPTDQLIQRLEALIKKL